MRTTERLARYLNQLVFCLYSEDAGAAARGAIHSHCTRTHYREPATFRRGDTQPVHD